MGDLQRGERLQIMLSSDELAALDEWRFTKRMPSRAAAIRELLKRGLVAEGFDLADSGSKSKDFGIIPKTSQNRTGRAKSGGWRVPVSEDLLGMAGQIIEARKTDFDTSKFRDCFEEGATMEWYLHSWDSHTFRISRSGPFISEEWAVDSASRELQARRRPLLIAGPDNQKREGDELTDRIVAVRTPKTECIHYGQI
jgi:hypothetical protein